MLWSSDVTGSSVTVGTSLPPTTIFWRLFSVDESVDGGAESPLSSPVWEFAGHGTHSAAHSSSWQTFNDFDGDGYADLVLYGDPGIQVFPGSSTGTSSVSEWTQDSEGGWASGDFDGNGTTDIVLVGFDEYTSAGGSTVYYSTPGTGLETNGTFVENWPQEWGGESSCFADDINGDGYADLVVTGYGPGGSGSFNTVLALFLGSSQGLVTTSPQILAVPNGTSESAGLAPAGDVNGDGYADFLLSEGNVVYLYLGTSTGLPSGSAKTLNPPAGVTGWGGLYTYNMAMLGDVNGDGYCDVALFGNNTNSGQTTYDTFVYFGSSSASALPTGPSETIDCGYNDAYMDVGGGDVNGDGYSDFVCTNWPAGNTNNLVFFPGSSTGLPTTSTVTFDGAFNGVMAVGDLNDDGYADFMATTVGQRPDSLDTFLGGSSFPTATSTVLSNYSWCPGNVCFYR